MDRTKQPLAIEVMPSQDRCAIVCMVRSDEPIGMAQLVYSLGQFTQHLQEKFIDKSPIEIPEKKIIL